MKKKISLILLSLLISTVISGCMLPFFGNRPVIESTPSLSAKAGKLYTYQVELNDDTSSRVVFSLLKAPDGMTIHSSNGLILWTPTEAQVGENEVIIRVNDGWYKDTQEFIIEVDIVRLDSISVHPKSMDITRPGTKSISSVTAYYDDGSSLSIAKSDCSYESSDSAVASVNNYGQVSGIIAGNVTISVSYTEEEITKSDTIDVTVINPTPPSGGG